MIGGVVAACAFHFDPKESAAEHVGFGGHGYVVFGCYLEASGASSVVAATKAEKFGDKAIKRDFVDEGIVDPPAEGTGVIEFAFDEARVLSKNVLPVAGPVVRVAGMVEEVAD